MTKARVLLYDIETTPNLAHVWDHYETNVIAYEKQWELLSFAYKWLGESKVYCFSRRTRSEKELVKDLHALFNEADFLIAHNGDDFDYKKTNAKFIEFGLKPPKPSTTIDTKKIAKKYFRFQTNKLDDLCEKLEVGRKQKHEGFDLWLGCMKGVTASLLKMESYNKQDVKILEKLYLKLRPWIKNQPGLAIAVDPVQCPNCGGYKMPKKGPRVRRQRRVQTYQCNDCGSWTYKNIKP
jgi:hypothetical protein